MGRIWSLVCGEPLAQFALAAGALFALYGAVAPPDEEAVRVTPEMVESLVEEREQILGRRLEAAERLELVDDFVDEEVLVREALARGLARRDGKIRHRLVSKMFFLEVEEPPEPSIEQLDAFYRANRERYLAPSSISFEQAFFETEPADPESVLEALAAGAPPGSLGDRFWLGGSFSEITEAELANGFGAVLARQLPALEPGSWHGPLASGRGFHFVRVTARHPPKEVSRQAIETRLQQDWDDDWRRRAHERRVAELRQRYRVIVEAPEMGR